MPAVKLDPRARILLLALGTLPPLCFNAPLPCGLVAGGCLLAGIAAGVPGFTRRAGLLALSLVFSSALLWGFFLGRGQVVLALGPVALRDLSALYGVAMGFRFASWSMASWTFLATTTVEDLAWGLHRLGLPHPVALGLSLSVRLTRQFAETASMVGQAQQVRGLDLARGGLLERLRKLAPMLVPLLVLSLRRVNPMAMAMEARGYGAGPRTSWLEHRWGGRETAWVVAASGLALACLVARLQGLGLLIPDRL